MKKARLNTKVWLEASVLASMRWVPDLRCVVGAGFFAAIAPVMMQASAQAAQLTNWQFDPATQRLEVNVPGGTSPRYFLLGQPARIVLDLPNTSVGNVPEQGNYSGLVRQIRVGQFEPGLTRIVIELSPDAVLAPQQVELEQVSADTPAGDRWALRPVFANAQQPPSPPIEADTPVMDDAPGELLSESPPITATSLPLVLPDNADGSEIAIDEDLDDELSTNELSDDELGTDELGTDELSDDELGTDELSDDELGSNELSDDELGADELGTDELSDDELGADDLSPNELSSNELNPNELSSNDLSDDELGSNDLSNNELSSNELSTNELSDVEVVSEPPSVPSDISSGSDGLPPDTHADSLPEDTASLETGTEEIQPRSISTASELENLADELNSSTNLVIAPLPPLEPGATEIPVDETPIIPGLPGSEQSTVANNEALDSAQRTDGESREPDDASSSMPVNPVNEDEIADDEIVEDEITDDEIAEDEITQSEIAENEIAENEIPQSEIAEDEIADDSESSTAILPEPFPIAEVETPDRALDEDAIAEGTVAEGTVAIEVEQPNTDSLENDAIEGNRLVPDSEEDQALEGASATSDRAESGLGDGDSEGDPIGDRAENNLTEDNSPEEDLINNEPLEDDSSDGSNPLLANQLSIARNLITIIDFGEPLLSSRASGDSFNLGSSGEEGNGVIVAANSDVLLPSGTQLPLRYPRTSAQVLVPNPPRQEVLLVNQTVRDSAGRVVVPEGSQVLGQFESTPDGFRFVTQAIRLNNQNIRLIAQSESLSSRLGDAAIALQPNQIVEIRLIEPVSR
ncbi:MAG: AMIN domain-containing protein [Elainellaceae cyanobacterium]